MSCAGPTYWSTWLRTTVDTAQRAKSGLGEPLNGTSLEGKGGKAHSILSSHLASHGRKNSITGVTKRHPSMPLMSCLGARSAPACFGIESWHDKAHLSQGARAANAHSVESMSSLTDYTELPLERCCCGVSLCAMYLFVAIGAGVLMRHGGTGA